MYIHWILYWLWAASVARSAPQDDRSAGAESHGVIAFDCNRTNLEVITFDLGKVGECTEMPNQSYHESKVNVQIIQVKDHEQVLLRRCRLITSTLVWHCGMHSHTAMANFDIAPKPVELSREQCVSLHSTRTLDMDGNHYTSLKLNGTTIWSETIVGSVWGEGNCEGGTYRASGYTYKNVVVKKAYTLTLQDQYAFVKLGSEEVMGFGGLSCKTGKTYCYDHEIGTMLWEIKTKECTQSKYESLYAGQGRKITTAMISHGMTDYIHVKSHEHGKFQLFTPLTGRTSLCGREAYTTPYNGLYLVEYTDMPRFDSEGPIAVNLDLIQYIEAKFMTFAYGMTLTTHQIVKKIAYSQCLTHRETLLNRLHIVASNPSSANLLMGNRPGIYGRVAGEVIHILNCPPVEVTLRKPEICTLEVPITYQGVDLYMDPKTRIIMDVYTASACSPLTPIMFRHGDHWLKMDPMFSYATRPKILHPSQEEYTEFTELLSYAQGGIYDPDDLQQLRDFMLFSVRRDVMESNVLAGMEGKRAPKYDLTAVLSEEGWRSIAKEHTKKLWGVMVSVGETVSGCVGIYFCFVVIKVVVGITIRTLSIYKVTGLSWQLLSGCWSVLSQAFWITHRGRSPPNTPEPEADVERAGGENIPLQEVPTEDVPDATSSAFTGRLTRSSLYPPVRTEYIR